MGRRGLAQRVGWRLSLSEVSDPARRFPCRVGIGFRLQTAARDIGSLASSFHFTPGCEGVQLPLPPGPFGHAAKFVGRVGTEFDIVAGREAARLGVMNVIAIGRQYLGSLDRVKQVVRLGVSIATDGGGRDLPKVADGASDFLQEILVKIRIPRVRCTESRVFRLDPLSRGNRYSSWRNEEDRRSYYGNACDDIIRGAPNLLSNHQDRRHLDFLP